MVEGCEISSREVHEVQKSFKTQVQQPLSGKQEGRDVRRSEKSSKRGDAKLKESQGGRNSSAQKVGWELGMSKNHLEPIIEPNLSI